MKSLIPLIFALFAIACEPEEIIKYIEKPVYLVRTMNTTTTDTVYVDVPQYDTIEITITDLDTVYIEKIIRDTVTNTILRVDTLIQVDTVFKTVTQIDTVYIQVVRIDTVERQTELVYDPALKNYVDSFFVYAEMVPETGGRLAVDIRMEIVYTEWRDVSSTTIVNGDYLITIDTTECYEAGVYRELLHTLYARPYINRDWNPMQQGWEGCLEGLNAEGRRLSLITMFIE